MQQTLYKKNFPDKFTLETPRVLLRLLQPDDFNEFSKITKDPIIWKYFTFNLADDEQCKNWIKDAIQNREACVRMPFTIIDKDINRIAGSTSYGNISFYDKRLEIGWTWIGTEFMGTGVNHHAKFALLSHAFEALGIERVEIKTDNLNERAKTALVKIGMQEEGVLRSHMQMWNNRRRDSIYYSILKDEWEAVKYRYFSNIE